jgi:hypothetical protein
LPNFQNDTGFNSADQHIRKVHPEITNATVKSVQIKADAAGKIYHIMYQTSKDGNY